MGVPAKVDASWLNHPQTNKWSKEKGASLASSSSNIQMENHPMTGYWMKPPWSLSVLGNFSVKTQNCQLQIAVEPDPGLRGLMLFASPRATNMSLLTKKGNAGNAFSDVNQ